jgi:hypothetical protein
MLCTGVFDVQDMQLLLRWLDMLARNPKGADDVKAVTGVLPPVQKLVLQLLGQINMVRALLQMRKETQLQSACPVYNQIDSWC